MPNEDHQMSAQALAVVEKLLPVYGVGKPGVDGKCTKALNVYNKFAICRNNQYTDTTRNEIVAFVECHMAKAR